MLEFNENILGSLQLCIKNSLKQAVNFSEAGC
jgi:hypothetical protein